MFLWLALHLSLAWGAALPQAESAPGPIPQHLAPFQLDGRSKPGYGGHGGGARQPVNIDLSVWKRGQTELQWYGDISIGSPPKTFKLIFDTGASLMLIAHKNSTTCGSHVLYDPSQSSTFSEQPGYKLEVTFGSQGGGTTSTPEVQGANCTVVTDTVRMAGQGARSEFLVCDNYSSGLRDQPPDGIFGLGSTPYALPSPGFSFSFVSDRGKGPRGRAGVLTLGGTDRSQYIPSTLKKIPLNWPLSESRWRWVVDVRGARIGGFTLTNSTDAVTLVDTGGAIIITPDKETTQQLYGRMSDQIVPLDDQGAWGAPCHVLDRVVRDVTFTVGSAQQNVDAVVKKEYINVGEYAGKPGICQGVFTDPARVAREPINGRPAWILGSPWLRSYYTVWNGEDRTLGFATLSHRDKR
ncbi:aspartic peptidase domain-containing protein [Chaetomidium leptoderma]|uniref:Aspartic peptidase domain-containing protein n=1 Tax=Chaetomidium leptoderma TaxID=669021 RepID=A0AAN6ZT22_9PEZI|nr:aspartic peptidase domain-containing protein [Chaetomidium leptoderma]